jgi:hypothetical protein
MFFFLMMMILSTFISHSTPQQLSRVTFARTFVQNQLWNDDAFPLTPIPPFGRVTILNASGGPGVVTHLHCVLVDLDGPDPTRAVNTAVSISVMYDNDPSLSFTVPYGAFFGDNFNGLSSEYESALFAKRATNALHAIAPMPFRSAVTIELISTSDHTIGGYTVAQYEHGPWEQGSGLFFAQYSAQSVPNWPFASVQILPQPLSGAGHVVGVSYTAETTRSDLMNVKNHFVGVCEGNWNWFVDNHTSVAGNASDPSLLSWMGSEDFFGQSYGWTPNTNVRSGTTLILDNPTRLSTYRMLVDAPIRFNATLTAAIQWDWDHRRIPTPCLAGESLCPVNFTVTVFYYTYPGAAPTTAHNNNNYTPRI